MQSQSDPLMIEIGVGEILGAGKREEYMWERE